MSPQRFLVLAVTVLASAAALAGCSAASPTPATSVAAPIQQDGGSYGTVIALRDAWIKAGAKCGGWTEDPDQVMPKAAQSGECGDWSLGNYATQSDKQWFVHYVQNQAAADGEDDPTALLVGRNWIVYGPQSEVAEMQPKFGGTEVDRPQK